MTTLIERLEAAEAGSLELDVLVHAAMVNPDVLVDGGHGFRGEDTCRFVKMADLISDGFPAADLEAYAPAYTTRRYDLTAALTLVPEWQVPEGWVWQVSEGWVWQTSSAGARLQKFESSGVWLDTSVLLHEIVVLKKNQPALALTTAALRAKEIEDEQS